MYSWSAMADLDSGTRRRGRRTFLTFHVFNAFSFQLVTGNVITLLLLRLGARSSSLGVIAALPYVAFLFLPVGRILIPRLGIVRLFGSAWLIRYIALVPVLLVPIIMPGIGARAGVIVVGLAVFGFHAARGLGIVSNAPIFSAYATDLDRGRFLSHSQIIAAVVSIAAFLIAASLLGRSAPIERYALVIGLGLLSGYAATAIAFRLPPIPTDPGAKGVSFFERIRQTADNRDFRRFLWSFFLIAMCSGVGRTYLVVFAKEVYGRADQFAVVLTAIGSLGNVAAGLIGSILLDRLGAKPLLQFATVTYLVGIFPALLTLPVQGAAVVVVLMFMFFLTSLGFTGAENASQAYFYGVTSEAEHLDLGIVFFLVLGIGGILGTSAGGFLLDVFEFQVGWGPEARFRLFFWLVAALATGAFASIRRLASLGADTFRNTTRIIFSFRDLRSITLLNRLQRTQTLEEERTTLTQIGQAGSSVSVVDVVARLDSPSYTIRRTALETLRALPFSESTELALRAHLTAYEFTTAHVAAEILGVAGSRSVDSAAGPSSSRDLTIDTVTALRNAVESRDYLLRAAAVEALGAIRDQESRTRIESIVDSGQNPAVLVHAAAALQSMGNVASVTVLFGRIAAGDVPPVALDEFTVVAAELLGASEAFHSMFTEYTREGATAGLVDFLRTGGHRHAATVAMGLPELDTVEPEALASVSSAFSQAPAGTAVQVMGHAATSVLPPESAQSFTTWPTRMQFLGLVLIGSEKP